MTNKQAYRPDGGDIGTDCLKEIASNVYGDEEKCWLAKRVLALLDELEAKDKSISFLKDQLAQLANFNPDWDKLEAATGSLREHMAELTSARARIAEMEAREVKLPSFEGYVPHIAKELQAAFRIACAAAGIRINGEG